MVLLGTGRGSSAYNDLWLIVAVDLRSRNDHWRFKRIVQMNEELKKIAVAAGAPEEMLDELWFNIFCQHYANLILEAIEEYDEE